MRILLLSFTAVLLAVLNLQAQSELTHVSVCKILEKPSAYDGKMLRVRGTVRSWFEFFALVDSDCKDAIALDFPDDPLVKPKPDFKAEEDDAYMNLRRLVTEYTRYAPALARATLVGRLDGVDELKPPVDDAPPGVIRGASRSSNGFGHLGQYRARLVIMRVVEVERLPLPEKPPSKPDQVDPSVPKY